MRPRFGISFPRGRQLCAISLINLHGTERLLPGPYSGGVNLAFEAPIDALYAATEINEAAFSAACEGNLHVDSTEVERLLGLVAEARQPKLIKLVGAARGRDISCLLDDDEVSIGLGRHSQTWRIDEVPDPSDVDWRSVADVDVALVTGTNGKSTTVRLTAAIPSECWIEYRLYQYRFYSGRRGDCRSW